MNMNADTAETWEELRAAYAEMEASGLPDYESWYLARFSVAEARRWASHGWTAGEAWTWIDLIERDKKQAAAWVAVGMQSPVDPFSWRPRLPAGRRGRGRSGFWPGFHTPPFSAGETRDSPTPATASQWAEVGLSPFMARSIMDARALPGRRRPR